MRAGNFENNLIKMAFTVYAIEVLTVSSYVGSVVFVLSGQLFAGAVSFVIAVYFHLGVCFGAGYPEEYYD